MPNSHNTSSHSQQPNQSYQHNNSNSRYEAQAEPSHSDYELVIEFELRRQRQKNRILEERLHNKQIFIQQMKQYQEELTQAFEKCQEELIAVRKNSQNFLHLEREYLEEIADLKHLVIRLQDEITLREKTGNRRHYSSVKQSQHVSPTKNKEQRSKTVMDNEESPEVRFKNCLQKQLINQSNKIAKFLKQFLMMVECFVPEAKEGPLKNRLKIAWKWVKNVVKEWNEQEKQKDLFEDFIQKAEAQIKHKTRTFHHMQSKSEALKTILKALK